MKHLKVFVLSVISLAMLFLSNHRMVILTLTSANLLSLIAQADSYEQKTITKEEQTANVTQAILNPAFSLSDSVASSAFSSFINPGRSKGLQFKDPVVSPGLTYRRADDGAPGGFGGNELSGDIGLDADVYDGLIAGLIYQHTYRGAENDLGTSEHLDSDGISLYGAKRFLDLVNVGLAYNFAATHHRLTRSVIDNLDRDSHGFTILAGLSNKKVFWSDSNKWAWSSTASYGFVHDDYDAKIALDTGRFSWGAGLNFDVTKWWSFGTAFNYHWFIHQESFSGTTARDNDYWTIGPRFQFYPTDRITVSLDFDSQEGYKNLSAYTTRLGVDIAF